MDLDKYVLREAPAGTRGCLMCCMTPAVCSQPRFHNMTACAIQAVVAGLLPFDCTTYSAADKDRFSRLYLAPAGVDTSAGEDFWGSKRVDVAATLLGAFVQRMPEKAKDVPGYFAEVVPVSVRLADALIKELKE